MDSVDAVCRVTVVGSARRLDVTLPVGVPVADLVFDLVEMMGERDGELPARWARRSPLFSGRGACPRAPDPRSLRRQTAAQKADPALIRWAT